MKIALTTVTLAALVCVPVANVLAQRAAAPVRSNANNADPAARPTPRLADGHPNLNGFWAIGRGPDTPVGSGFGDRDPNIKRGDARNAAAQYADPEPATLQTRTAAESPGSRQE